MNTNVSQTKKMKPTFNQSEFKNELEDFLNLMGMANESRELSQFQTDLLPLMFREYVTSDWFATSPPERKRELVDQYDHLVYILKHLDDFISKYSTGDIKILDVKAEMEELTNQNLNQNS